MMAWTTTVKRKKQSKFLADDALTPKVIVKNVNLLLKTPTPMMRKASDHIPPQVAAFIQYVFKLFPFKFKGGTIDIMAKDGRGAGGKLLKFYRKHFPPGTVGFTIPRSDETTKPDPNYQVLEGRTIYIVQWELNIPRGAEFQCFGKRDTPCSGKFVHNY